MTGMGRETAIGLGWSPAVEDKMSATLAIPKARICRCSACFRVCFEAIGAPCLKAARLMRNSYLS